MSSFGGKVLGGGILAVIGLVTVKVLVAVVSGIMALIGFLVFTVLPILLVGWFVLKAIKYMKSDEKPAFD
jgi:small-conductance mechanosensitive channel